MTDVYPAAAQRRALFALMPAASKVAAQFGEKLPHTPDERSGKRPFCDGDGFQVFDIGPGASQSSLARGSAARLPSSPAARPSARSPKERLDEGRCFLDLVWALAAGGGRPWA
jgi:hypothetical protein